MRRLGFGLAYGVLALAVAGLGAYLAVSLVVERAPEVEVPDVTGRGLAEALDELGARGLDLEVRAFVYSDEVPENRVVRQKPEAGQVVKAGRAVGLVLSRGPERHLAPDVRGLSLEDGRILLEQAELKAEVALRLHRGPEGQIVAQGVQPGHRLPAETPIPLAVSSGPAPLIYRAPLFEGLPLEEALSRLDELGLRAARVEEVSLEDPSRQGRVVSQDPLPGFPVARGTGVTLSVAGTARPVVAVRGVWISRAMPPGFGQHRVEVLLEDAGATWVLADEWVRAGEEFRRWVPRQPGERLRVRVDGVDVRDEAPTLAAGPGAP